MNLISAPPPATAVAAMTSIEGLRIVATMLNTQSRPSATSARKAPDRS